jgi:hypothetical protein
MPHDPAPRDLSAAQVDQCRARVRDAMNVLDGTRKTRAHFQGDPTRERPAAAVREAEEHLGAALTRLGQDITSETALLGVVAATAMLRAAALQLVSPGQPLDRNARYLVQAGRERRTADARARLRAKSRPREHGGRERRSAARRRRTSRAGPDDDPGEPPHGGRHRRSS